MIDNDVFIVFVALATLCTIIIIGLGFLPRPSREAAIWSGAFVGAMCASYVWLAGNVLGLAPLRSAGIGIVLTASMCMWVGLRARRAAERTYLAPILLLGVALTALIVISAETSWAEIGFRAALLVAAAVAAATTSELFRMGPLHRDEILPLALASLAFIIVTAAGVVDGALRLARGESLEIDGGVLALRALGVLGGAVYFVAALVTLLLLVREERAGTHHALRFDFSAIARDRLARAEVANDLWWSVLEIRLDDPIAIREATSTAAYNRVVARFASDVLSMLPAEADIDQKSASRYVVLLPRPDASVRPILSRLLARVATPTEGQGIETRLSASIGWAPVGLLGFSLDTLLAAAADAADTAQREGGDRWERADELAFLDNAPTGNITDARPA